jgi:hypothetical protein
MFFFFFFHFSVKIEKHYENESKITKTTKSEKDASYFLFIYFLHGILLLFAFLSSLFILNSDFF